MFRTEEERREANRPYHAALMTTVWIVIGVFTAVGLHRPLLGAGQALLGVGVATDEVLRKREAAKTTRTVVRVLFCGGCAALLLAHMLR
jgi:hypothetical protein